MNTDSMDDSRHKYAERKINNRQILAKKVGAEIRKYRKSLGMDYKEFAKYMGTKTPETWQKYEYGESLLSNITLMYILSKLGIDFEKFADNIGLNK